MLTEGDFIVRPIRLPRKVKALIALDESGFANIYVNDQISAADQQEAIHHELMHLGRDDAYNDRPIQRVEGG